MSKIEKAEKAVYWVILALLATLVIASAAGCGLLPVTDGQIESIAQTTGKVVETATSVGGRMLGLPSEVSGGVSGVVALGVVLGVRALLKSLQKKKDDHIVKVVSAIRPSSEPPA